MKRKGYVMGIMKRNLRGVEIEKKRKEKKRKEQKHVVLLML